MKSKGIGLSWTIRLFTKSIREYFLANDVDTE